MIFFVYVGSWLSLKVIQCRNVEGIYNTSLCYKTKSGKTCFTTFLVKYSRAVVRPFTDANIFCKAYVPGSNLVVIRNAEDQHIVEDFIGRLAFNEPIITDEQRVLEWSWVNGHRIIPEGKNSLHFLGSL